MKNKPQVPSVVRIGKRGTLVIPSGVREALNLKEGDRMDLIVQEGEIRLRPARQGRLSDLYGALAGSGVTRVRFAAPPDREWFERTVAADVAAEEAPRYGDGPTKVRP